MQKLKLIPATFVLSASLLICVNSDDVTASEVNAVDMVSAMEEAFGVTPGRRRNHTKGTCAEGEFVGLTEGANYSYSALFSGNSIPVTARFSLGGGNPRADDSEKGVRGLALQFKLPGGGLQNMAMLNVPVFGASVPETFFDFLVALKPDPVTGSADPETLQAFVESHPDFQAMDNFIATHNPPTSYANAPYYGLHAFKFVNASGRQTLVRWQFQPQDGLATLSDGIFSQGTVDFLESALIKRARLGPINWDMFIQIGQPGDAENDSSQPWPESRRKVKVGTLSLTQVSSQENGNCGEINFDPLVVSDGILPTDDPVLHIRSSIYAISFQKRLSEQNTRYRNRTPNY